MVTQKWRKLDPLCEAFTQVKGIASSYAGFYEAAHKPFKELNALSGKRKRSAMNEIVAM